MSLSCTIRRPVHFWLIDLFVVPARDAVLKISRVITAVSVVPLIVADLVNPRSTLTGVTPEIRSAPHLFIQLEQLHESLNEWSQNGDHLQQEVANYLKGHFLCDVLRDWDVSRPAPYFGFEIPDSPGNYWYVWFDAPIGYIGSTQQWCEREGESLEHWWRNPKTEIHHFIGKDITYFHTLFWPGMLKTAGYKSSTRVHIHGFLTIGGEKMSKSKGTFVMASTFLKHLNPEALRYYYAAKLGSGLDDIDLNLDEFVARVNSDLVGKIVNLASRTARFLTGQTLSEVYPADGDLFQNASSRSEAIALYYEDGNYNAAMREIMQLADRANKYVDDLQPWTLKKNPDDGQKLRDVCTVTLNLYRQLVVYLAPVLPRLAEQTGLLLNSQIRSWNDAQTPLTGTMVSPFQTLMNRIETTQVQAMIEDSKPQEQTPEIAAATGLHPAHWLARQRCGPGQ